MGQLHIALVPAMAHGHMIPTLDMAKIFTSRGLKATVIATPSFAHSIEKARESGRDIGLSILDFPPEKSSLPRHIVSLDQVSTPELLPLFLEAMSLLQEPFEKLLYELNPDCLVSDTFLPWTVDSAAKLGIPRLVFHGTSCFALCALEQMNIHKPYRNAPLSVSEPLVLANVPLPHKLTFVRTQIHGDDDEHNISMFKKQMRVSDGKSYGVIINSFHELESSYADYYKDIIGKKAWHIGPLVLCANNNRWGRGKLARRGRESSIDEHECLAWLNSKRPNSVIYVCFGSVVASTRAQLHETAAGLVASGQDFILVIRRGKHEDETNECVFPRRFEERMKRKGLIIRGWAPQAMILDHPSIGAFVTHCGWNSTLEGICAGVPMVTWPAFADQFLNEKLVTEVLGTGVSVCSNKWKRAASEGVSRETVEKAVRRVMVGEAAEEMRSRAKCYKEIARKAVGEGGSSYSDLNALIDELSILCLLRNMT